MLREFGFCDPCFPPLRVAFAARTGVPQVDKVNTSAMKLILLRWTRTKFYPFTVTKCFQHFTATFHVPNCEAIKVCVKLGDPLHQRLALSNSKHQWPTVFADTLQNGLICGQSSDDAFSSRLLSFCLDRYRIPGARFELRS